MDSCFLGFNLAISGDGMIIAVAGADFCSVYHLVGAIWKPKGNNIDIGDSGDLFGTRVVLASDGHYLVAASPFDDTFVDNAGLVRVYEFNNNNGWETSELEEATTEYQAINDETY